MACIFKFLGPLVPQKQFQNHSILKASPLHYPGTERLLGYLLFTEVCHLSGVRHCGVEDSLLL